MSAMPTSMGAGLTGYSTITPIQQQAQTPPASPFTPQQGVNQLHTSYTAALGNLQNAANLSNQTTSGEQMQLGNTLANQQSAIGQNLANRGLGNTTVSATASQAPMQQYNTAMANVANQSALRQMSAQDAMAQMTAQAGNAAANMMNPYAQANYGAQINAANTANQENFQDANQAAYTNLATQNNAAQQQQQNQQQQQYQQQLTAMLAQNQGG